METTYCSKKIFSFNSNIKCFPVLKSFCPLDVIPGVNSFCGNNCSKKLLITKVSLPLAHSCFNYNLTRELTGMNCQFKIRPQHFPEVLVSSLIGLFYSPNSEQFRGTVDLFFLRLKPIAFEIKITGIKIFYILI